MSTYPQPEGQAGPQPVAVPPSPRETRPEPPRRSPCGCVFVAFLVFALGGSLLANFILAGAAGVGLAGALDADRRVQEKFVSQNATATDKVAILPIEGLILESDDGFVRRAIDTAIKDESVKAVVLRVNSPGGSVTGSDYIYHHLRRLTQERKIPIVVSMGGIAASGGYYVSMAAGTTPDIIFAEPTSFTGSIGVVIPHYNLAELMKKVGAEEDSVASHPLKLMGSFSKPMTEEERRIFQSLVSDSFRRFKEIVRSGRSRFQKDPAALDRLATGQIYSADQALANGLVDRLGFLEDAVDRAIALAKLRKENVKVVRYKQEVSLSSLLFSEQSHTSAAVEVRALFEMVTPRAYYLCTWLE